MNNSINYSSFVDLILTSNEEIEPYGMPTSLNPSGLRGSKPEITTRQEPLHFDEMDRWIGE